MHWFSAGVLIVLYPVAKHLEGSGVSAHALHLQEHLEMRNEAIFSANFVEKRQQVRLVFDKVGSLLRTDL